MQTGLYPTTGNNVTNHLCVNKCDKDKNNDFTAYKKYKAVWWVHFVNLQPNNNVVEIKHGAYAQVREIVILWQWVADVSHITSAAEQCRTFEAHHKRTDSLLVSKR